MAALDISSALDALKTFYSKDKIENMMYQDRPFFALLDKKTDFVGDKYKVPLRLTNPQGRSATFVNAQANKIPSKYRAFYLERVKNYALASITTEAILASQNDAGAFLRLATGEIDGALDSLTRSLAFQLYGDASGTIGTVSSVASSNPAMIQLASVEDIVKFEVGQTLEVWSPANAQHTWGAGGVLGVVSNIDRDLGQFAVTSDNSGPTATAVPGDLIFVSGDRNNAMSGLQSWLPMVAPTSAPFFGVDRSIDVVRLGGLRKAYPGVPVEEAIIDMARKVSREGGQPSHLFLSFPRYAALEKSLGTKIRYDQLKVAGVTFNSIRVNGPKGDIAIVADQDCPQDKGFMLDLKHWSLYSLGQAVQILDLDGNKMLREQSADAMEIRVGSFGQLGCRAPGKNGIMSFV